MRDKEFLFDQLTPEREKEIIEKVAQVVVNNGIQNLGGILQPAYDYGYSYFGNIITTTTMIELFPFSFVLGDIGLDMCVFLQSDPKGSMERIMDRVRELNEEKKKEDAAKRVAMGNKSRMPFWKKVRSSFPKKSLSSKE
ncbi:MAG: hypothetical protein QG670_1674 [Thermoproteota archaeon]|nr:hypothetical protein [Thermoproteota archaeon]